MQNEALAEAPIFLVKYVGVQAQDLLVRVAHQTCLFEVMGMGGAYLIKNRYCVIYITWCF
jgi:hypothetical protein